MKQFTGQLSESDRAKFLRRVTGVKIKSVELGHNKAVATDNHGSQSLLKRQEGMWRIENLDWLGE
jgi:hypothetical protein